MLAAGKWILGVVTGGVLLGAVLGKASEPDMKDPPAPWWQLTGRDEAVASGDGYQFVEAGPQDLNPGGYRPDLDYEALAWNLPLPDYELAYLVDEPLEAPADGLPVVTYGITAAEDAADEAEAAAGEALAAEPSEAEPAPGPASGEVRKSELALAGLY